MFNPELNEVYVTVSSQVKNYTWMCLQIQHILSTEILQWNLDSKANNFCL